MEIIRLEGIISTPPDATLLNQQKEGQIMAFVQYCIGCMATALEAFLGVIMITMFMLIFFKIIKKNKPATATSQTVR